MFSTLSATFHDAIVPTAIGHGIIHVDLMKNNYLYQQLDPKWQIQHFADKLYYWQIPQLAEFHCSSLSLSLTQSITSPQQEPVKEREAKERAVLPITHVARAKMVWTAS